MERKSLGHETYLIPWQDKFIVYQPLNRLAFIGNLAMVNLLKEFFNGREPDSDRHADILSFLDSAGFFNPVQITRAANPEEKYQPTVAVLCMTSSCNFRCTYCFANGGESGQAELDLVTGMKAIDIVHQNARSKTGGHFTVSFHGGGEPTLPFEKLKKLVAYARSKVPAGRIELTSNGYWSKAKTAWILENIDHLTLSFDGVQSVQDKQRLLANGKGSYTTVLRNILKLDESKVSYGIRLTVTGESVTGLVESIGFLTETTRCSTFQVEPAFGAGRAIPNNLTIIEPDGFIREFLLAYDLAASRGRHIYYSGARPWVLSHCFCSAHDNALVVTPEGGLSSCYEISGSDHPLAGAFHFGSISKTGVMQIDHSIREQFRQKTDERKAICESCFCYWHCAGDCPAKTIRPGDFTNTLFSQRCEVNREITKELLIRNLLESDGVWKGH